MNRRIFQAELNCRAGKQQVDQQHDQILAAAETIFLCKGLENTTMADIAGQAGVTRVTLYRYFAGRGEIAVKIQARMFKKINAVLPLEDQRPTLESHRRLAQTIIRSFGQLRDAFRYIGMFDRLYLDHDAGGSLPQWAKAQLQAARPGPAPHSAQKLPPPAYRNELTVLISAVIWFLEKLALRGELTWSDQDILLEQHLQVFEQIIMGYFDRLIAADQAELSLYPGRHARRAGLPGRADRSAPGRVSPGRSENPVPARTDLGPRGTRAGRGRFAGAGGHRAARPGGAAAAGR